MERELGRIGRAEIEKERSGRGLHVWLLSAFIPVVNKYALNKSTLFRGAPLDLSDLLPRADQVMGQIDLEP